MCHFTQSVHIFICHIVTEKCSDKKLLWVIQRGLFIRNGLLTHLEATVGTIHWRRRIDGGICKVTVANVTVSQSHFVVSMNVCVYFFRMQATPRYLELSNV